MKNSYWRFLKGIGYLSDNLLNIYAIINVVLLILYNYLNQLPSYPYINSVYTELTIYLLIVNFISHIMINRFSILSLRTRIPDIILILLGLSLSQQPYIFQLLIIGRQIVILGHRYTKNIYQWKRFKNITDNAAIFVLISFFIAIMIGTLLLLLPISTAEGNSTNFVGALFTSTSATCVTGLIVYDTGTHFTLFGQVIILLLIQIGGLGIMTISTSFAILTGQRLTFRGEKIMQSVFEERSRFDMLRLIRNIVLVTIIFEFIGAIFLYSAFSGRYDSTSNAVYSAIFHSISAFCNAGFSLNPDSFALYKSHIGINITMMLLIIFGGLGFSVLVDIKRNLLDKVRPVRFSLHTKLVLITTIALILLGFFLYFVSEYNHSMESFSLKERFFGSLFQSVTTRTAGFNTVDVTQFSKSSVFISVVLMFIGASPGSTGGGIKTTSFAVIILSVMAILSSNRDVIVFKRKISDNLIKRVMALIAISILLLFIIIFFLMLIEPFAFEHIMFEAFSAFGTVGLSMGITPYLSQTGRILITILMYFGRIGPLTFIFALSRAKVQTDYMYSEEKVSVG
ncbi:MAG: TrkH family potassium uptake protein [Candidatus Cloacimonetes bacterium]|nr:TrkH family potassium uptake protein [Candidatus Cloacimonadota bacterium]